MRDLVQIYRAALLNSLSITPFPSQITFSRVRNKSGTASFGGFASPGVKIELADTSFSELMSPSLSLRLSSCCLSFCRGFTASSGGAGGILEESAFGVDLPGGRRTRGHQGSSPRARRRSLSLYSGRLTTPAFLTTCFVATCTPLRLPATGSPVTSPAGLSRSGDTHVSPTTWQACRGALRGWLTSPGGGRAVPPDKPWVGATSGSCWARPASQAEAAGACAGGWSPSSPLCPRAPCVPGRRRAPGAPRETSSPLFPPRRPGSWYKDGVGQRLAKSEVAVPMTRCSQRPAGLRLARRARLGLQQNVPRVQLGPVDAESSGEGCAEGTGRRRRRRVGSPLPPLLHSSPLPLLPSSLPHPLRLQQFLKRAGK